MSAESASCHEGNRFEAAWTWPPEEGQKCANSCSQQNCEKSRTFCSIQSVHPKGLEEADSDEANAEWIFSSREELSPDQTLLNDVPANHSFAGVTIEELQNMAPLPKIPAPYRHDALVDSPAKQMDFGSWKILTRSQREMTPEPSLNVSKSRPLSGLLTVLKLK